ncbi:DUF190 domain-containing protein [Mycobacterium sp. WMMD1722]|uniref:DUF190 domain-containing protein n=1 Tax=Mycobacterium sp. WMMD1722 TaxID=3404117 RepID=UPI003BF60366
MTAEHLKLTAYFGERLRSGHRFTVDALLDLLAADDMATSVVLRGIAGFGPRHRLRTDVSLSLSEDPPVTVIAVDLAEHIERIAPQVVNLVDRGLVTIEEAWSPEEPPEHPSIQLTVALSGGDHVAVVDVLRTHGFAAATAYRGVDGTVGGARRRAGFFSRNVAVPTVVLAVGPASGARPAATDIRGLPGVELVTVDAAQVCKVGGRQLARPERAWPRQRLMVHTASADLHDGLPVHRALVRALLDVQPTAGVTVLHGVWGYQGDREPHADRMFQFGRRAPVTTVMIDTAERIAAAFDVVGELTGDAGVVSVGPVPAAVSIDDGERRGTLRYDG